MSEPQSNHVQHPMVVAYHTLFDYKDTLDIHGSEFMEVYSMLRSMKDAMRLLGVTPPERFDAPREPEVTTRYTVSATFDGNKDETWDEWAEWLTDPKHLEGGTVYRTEPKS